jgi:predicted DNA binding CopG/RHH family protein
MTSPRPRPLTVAQTTLRSITIRLALDDIRRAKKQASERGVGYQTYIRMVLHQELRRIAGAR